MCFHSSATVLGPLVAPVNQPQVIDRYFINKNVAKTRQIPVDAVNL